MPTFAIGPDQNDPEFQPQPIPTESATPSKKRTRYHDPNKKFSSSNPNNEDLLWALIDDSELGREAHDEAVAIMEGYAPTPWKGMVWHGIVGQGRVWNGSSWQVPSPDPLVYKPITTPMAASQASPRLIELFRSGDTGTVGADELNAQYEAWVLAPETEAENLHLSVSAFIRSKWRMAQARKLIAGNPELWIEIDDIFADFVIELFEEMAKGKYCHSCAFPRSKSDMKFEMVSGRMDGWIAYRWDNYFFPDQQKKVIEYLKSTRFVNNVEPGSMDYVRSGHCVNTANLTSDKATGVEPGVLVKGPRDSDGKVVTFRVTADMILRDLDDTRTSLGQVSQKAKIILREVANGSTQIEAGLGAGISTRQTSRLLHSAIKDEPWVLATPRAQTNRILLGATRPPLEGLEDFIRANFPLRTPQNSAPCVKVVKHPTLNQGSHMTLILGADGSFIECRANTCGELERLIAGSLHASSGDVEAPVEATDSACPRLCNGVGTVEAVSL